MSLYINSQHHLLRPTCTTFTDGMFGIISTLENAGLKMLACNLGLQHAVWGLLFVATKNLFYENCPQVENFVVRYLRYASQILHHLKPEKFRQPEKMFRRVQSDVTELN